MQIHGYYTDIPILIKWQNVHLLKIQKYIKENTNRKVNIRKQKWDKIIVTL